MEIFAYFSLTVPKRFIFVKHYLFCIQIKMSSSTSEQPDTTTAAGTSQELVIKDSDKLRVLALHGKL